MKKNAFNIWCIVVGVAFFLYLFIGLNSSKHKIDELEKGIEKVDSTLSTYKSTPSFTIYDYDKILTEDLNEDIVYCYIKEHYGSELLATYLSTKVSELTNDFSDSTFKKNNNLLYTYNEDVIDAPYYNYLHWEHSIQEAIDAMNPKDFNDVNKLEWRMSFYNKKPKAKK